MWLFQLWIFIMFPSAKSQLCVIAQWSINQKTSFLLVKYCRDMGSCPCLPSVMFSAVHCAMWCCHFFFASPKWQNILYPPELTQLNGHAPHSCNPFLPCHVGLYPGYWTTGNSVGWRTTPLPFVFARSCSSSALANPLSCVTLACRFLCPPIFYQQSIEAI